MKISTLLVVAAFFSVGFFASADSEPSSQRDRQPVNQQSAPPANQATPQPAGQSQPVVQQVIAKTQTADIVFWGEIHEIREQSQLLQNFIDSTAGTFDAVVTEYVFAEENETFQAYLNDPQATSSSEAESNFFTSLSKLGLIWARTEPTRDTYRALWRLKQSHPATKICGIDRRYSIHSTPEFKQKIWNSAPAEVRDYVLKMSRLPEDQVVAGGGGDLIREIGMAMSTYECIKDSKRALVHSGAYHGSTPGRYPLAFDWRPLSTYLSMVMPSRKIATIYNTLNSNDPGQDDEVAFTKVFRLSGLKSASLMTNKELTPYRKLLDKKAHDGTMSSYRMWDFYIVGPLAHESQKISWSAGRN
jgi:hypothetical protein